MINKQLNECCNEIYKCDIFSKQTRSCPSKMIYNPFLKKCDSIKNIQTLQTFHFLEDDFDKTYNYYPPNIAELCYNLNFPDRFDDEEIHSLLGKDVIRCLKEAVKCVAMRKPLRKNISAEKFDNTLKNIPAEKCKNVKPGFLALISSLVNIINPIQIFITARLLFNNVCIKVKDKVNILQPQVETIALEKGRFNEVVEKLKEYEKMASELKDEEKAKELKNITSIVRKSAINVQNKVKKSVEENIKKGIMPTPNEETVLNTPISASIFALPYSRQLLYLDIPSSFYFYPNVHNKRILLMGEGHYYGRYRCSYYKNKIIQKNNLFKIHEWLSALSKDSKECLDLFVELDYILDRSEIDLKLLQKMYESKKSGIKELINTFANCFLASKGSNITCKYKNLRYHYANARTAISKTNIIEPENELYFLRSPFTIIHDTLLNDYAKYDYYKKEIIAKLSRNTCENIIYYLLGLNKNGTAIKDILDIITNINLKFNYIVIYITEEDLESYYKFYFRIIEKELSKLDPTIDRNAFLKTMASLYLQDVHKYPDMADNFHCVNMDVYLLSRLFIRFDEKKLGRGPEKCREKSNLFIKNAIIYGGDYHILFYKKFIEKFFGILPYPDFLIESKKKIAGILKQCIIFKKPFDFFGKYE